MNFNDYQGLADRTANKDSSVEDTMLNASMGMCGESAEVLEHMKKVLFQGHTLNEDKLIEEAGDCLWYVALLATALGVPMSQIAERNIDKLRKRYPAGFSALESVNRIV